MPADILPWNSSALPWHIEYMFQAMFYMILGYIFKKKLENILDKYINWKTIAIVVMIYLLIVYIPYAIEMTLPVPVDILYNYISAIVGITAVVMVSKMLPSNNYVNYIGQNTLICFALHGKIYSVIQTILKKIVGTQYMAIQDNIIISSFFALLFALFLPVIIMVPIYIINRYFPFIIGRKTKSV